MTSTQESETDSLNHEPALRTAQTPRGIRRLARALLGVLIVFPFALLVVPWQQNVRGEGRVTAYAPLQRRQAVEAPIEGRIVRVWVAEGSVVKEGDPLFEITDNDPHLLKRIRGQVAAAKTRLGLAQEMVRAYDEQGAALGEAQRLAILAAGERVRMADQMILAGVKAIEAADIAHATARLNFARSSDLRRDKLASQREWELARLQVRQAAAELARQRAALEAVKRDRAGRVAERGKIKSEFEARVRSARARRESAASTAASVQSALLGLQVRLARQKTQRVTAPLAGTVFRLAANQGGEMVKAGDPVVVIVPEAEELAVELWVDGNDLPLLSVGRKARLQFEGWPAVQFAGWPSVAVGTFGGEIRLIDATDDGQGRFRVLLKPDPTDEQWPARRFLRQGVQVRGWVLLERVTLGFEFWRQINGFPPVIKEPQQKQKKGKQR